MESSAIDDSCTAENTDAPVTVEKDSPFENQHQADSDKSEEKADKSMKKPEEDYDTEEGEVEWNKESVATKKDSVGDGHEAELSADKSKEDAKDDRTSESTEKKQDVSNTSEEPAGADRNEDGRSVKSVGTAATKPSGSEATSPDFGDADMERLLGEPVDLEVLARNVEEDDGEDDFEIHDDSSQEPKQNRHTSKRRKKKPGRFSDSFEGELPVARRSSSKIVKSGIPQTHQINPLWKEPFEQGWKREIVLRGTYEAFDPTGRVKGRPADVYYFAPNGKKLRSKVEVEKHLVTKKSPFTVQNFTFMKERIFEPPLEYIRTAGGRRTPKKHTRGTSQKDRRDSADSFGSSKYSTNEGKNGSEESNADSSKAMIVKLPATEDNKTTVVLMSGASSTTGVKRAVAKKHTGKKRGRPPQNGMATSVKRPKISKDFGIIKHEDYRIGELQQKLCGLDCPGMKGVPPSLHCEVCMCMFHPACVQFFLDPQSHGFVCMACQKSETGKDQNKNTSHRPASHLPLHPPPLKPGQKIIKIAKANQSMAGNGCIRLTNSATPVSMVVNTNPSLLTQSVAPSAGAIHISLPTMNPNQITGQLLTLPAGIAQKLSLNENLTLKVHGKTFIVPPTCFISTPDGIKVLLPPGSLPEKSVHGPSKPLDVHMDSQQAGSQMISLDEPNSHNVSRVSSELTSRQTKSSSPNLPEVSHHQGPRSRRKFRDGINPALCFVKILHSGFDCMLHIFHYLSIPDLLKASRVCSTWNGMALQRCLWQNVKLKGALVTDWIAAAKFFDDRQTKKLDMKGMRLSEDKNKTWHQFMSALEHMKNLKSLEFDKCPASILHSVGEKLLLLESLTAEFITDSMTEPQMWTTNAKLDIGKFSKAESLKSLKLRGICGLSSPAFSFSGGLTELGSLTNITSLSLTTLREIPDYEFTFLGSLEKLESLEIGDCNLWTKDTFSGLGKLTNLRSLRLESGGAIPDVGLGEALKNKERLVSLELIKWLMAENLATDLHQLKQLKTFTVWPYTTHESQIAEVNGNTMKAVSSMPFLNSLEWAIIMDCGRDSPVETADGESLSVSDCIPIQDRPAPQENGEQPVTTTRFLSINSMVKTLRSHLPDSKLRVFKVPTVANRC